MEIWSNAHNKLIDKDNKPPPLPLIIFHNKMILK